MSEEIIDRIGNYYLQRADEMYRMFSGYAFIVCYQPPTLCGQQQLKGFTAGEEGKAREYLRRKAKEGAEQKRFEATRDTVQGHLAKGRIAELEREARQRAREAGDGGPASKELRDQVRRQAGQLAALRKGLEDAMKVIAEINAKGFEAAGIDPEIVKRAVQSAADQIVQAAQHSLGRRQAEFDKLRRDATTLLEKLQKLVSAEDLNVRVDVRHNPPFEVTPRKGAVGAVAPAGARDVKGREELTKPERKILDAYAWWHSIGVDRPGRQNIAPLAGYSNMGSSGFRNPLYACQASGLVQDDALTERGRELAEWPAAASDLASYHGKLKSIMEGPVQKLFDALHEAKGTATREQLAAATGYTNAGSSGFRNPLYRLSSMGLVSFSGGEVKATELMYPPSLM